jgi:hypothetical protein
MFEWGTLEVGDNPSPGLSHLSNQFGYIDPMIFGQFTFYKIQDQICHMALVGGITRRRGCLECFSS